MTKMPYISREISRHRIAYHDDPLCERVDKLIRFVLEEYESDEFEGVCNYIVSRVVAGVMKPKTGWRYKWLNRAYGTFMAAGAEFYRRLIAPYEDECIKKNGDIPEYDEAI